ncbi:MAG TPA: aldehyde dehydrogenase (NADP(+)), partial [Xanthomarina gelatinilytica]|nr:aldehyde dehydrogenase (NADP(+)) [Xanthomarina gelatinilytica]
MISGKNYIGNQLTATGTKTYKTFNPQLHIENQPVYTEATKEEINAAVTLASQAFKTFRNISGEQKAAFLNAIADEIMALDSELIATYCSETG